MNAPLKIGISTLFTDRAPVAVTDLARMLEERGFESLWFSEHTHIPVKSRIGGLPIASTHARLCDPFVLLSAAAAVTSRLRLGTGICLAAEYEPIGLAHLVATLDMVSGGRVELGVGYGSNLAEIRNRRVNPEDRRDILRENVLAMKEIWTKEVASFDGRFVKFSDIWSWPKPVQKPHPPVLLGVMQSTRFPDLVEFCEGWYPNKSQFTDDELRQRIDELHRTAEKAGRDPATIGISLTVPSTSPSRPDANPLNLEEFREMCITRRDADHYATFGVERQVIKIGFPTKESVEPMLDHLAKELFG